MNLSLCICLISFCQVVHTIFAVFRYWNFRIEFFFFFFFRRNTCFFERKILKFCYWTCKTSSTLTVKTFFSLICLQTYLSPFVWSSSFGILLSFNCSTRCQKTLLYWLISPSKYKSLLWNQICYLPLNQFPFLCFLGNITSSN